MQPSGQTVAHAVQPMQVSALISSQYAYPRWFTAVLQRANVCVGQATTQRLQPLHRSVSMTTAPLILAISVEFLRI